MEEAQNLMEQGQDGIVGDVTNNSDYVDSSSETNQSSNEDDLPRFKDRLSRQERKHQREMRELRHANEALHEKINLLSNNQSRQESNSYDHQNGDISEQIHRAVSNALSLKEKAERDAVEQRKKSQLMKDVDALNKHLDKAGDKYEDFDELVMGDAPFTEHMVHAALSLPHEGPGSPSEVFYKLAKNPQELERISQLLPHQQQREIAKLSHALVRAKDHIKDFSSSKPLNQIKSMPHANQSRIITDGSSPSDIRKILYGANY